MLQITWPTETTLLIMVCIYYNPQINTSPTGCTMTS
ncbi:hypothetical protein LINGRAPRIM_LOCUS2847 [Linum grandiflorum]